MNKYCLNQYIAIRCKIIPIYCNTFFLYRDIPTSIASKCFLSLFKFELKFEYFFKIYISNLNTKIYIVDA